MKKKNPIGPKGNLITGHLKAFQSNPLKFLTNLATDYGEFVPFRLGPFQKVYLINNPDLIKEVLVTKQKSFIKSKDIQTLKTLVGNGLLTSEKDFHRKQRKQIQPSFTRAHISNYGVDMINTTSKYLSTWKDGEVRSIFEDMMNITLGIISKTMFSMDFEEGAKRIGEPMETVMKQSIRRMRSIITFPMWVPTKQNRKYKEAIQALDLVLYDLIKNRKQNIEAHEDLLSVLLKAKDAHTNECMSDKQLRDELMTIFLAGHETTANALTWTLFLLGQHPHVEKKFFQELDQVLGVDSLTPGHFKNLTYTQNIVWESLRLYPPAYVIGRQVHEAVQIGPHRLKKGDMVILSQYVMHRNEKFFYDPNSFIPERFENEFVKTLPTYAYFPFGGGPRVCIGNHFAIMEAVLVLASIGRRFQLILTDDSKIRPQPLITLRPRGELKMMVKER